MAQVYLGYHDGIDRPVAVKRLRRQLAGDDTARERLRNEAEIARRLNHEHIVDVLGLMTDPAGDSYLVMEHLAGEPLSARLARTGALPLSEVLTISRQIAAALEAVHARHIVHRDLKTENVLVGLDPNGNLRAKLVDFGVAEILGSPDGSISCSTVIGTPEAMSPEQAMGGPIDRRSDIYSFGVLVYEMVAGGPPFMGSDINALLGRLVNEQPLPPSSAPGAQRQVIPDALEQLILHCLAKSPVDRPQEMSDVRAQLEAIAADYSAAIDAIERAMREDGSDDGIGTLPAQDPILVVQGALAASAHRVGQSPVGPARCASTELAPLLAPVRAVGTSGDGHGPVVAEVAEPEALPALTWSAEQWIAVESEPTLVDESGNELGPAVAPVLAAVASTRDEAGRPTAERVRGKRISRSIGAWLFFGVVALGVGGMVGSMLWTARAHSELLELHWHR